MIFKEYTVTVKGDVATINEPVYLYKYDKNVELRFNVGSVGYKYTKSDADNLVIQSGASFCQVRFMNKESQLKYTFDICPTVDGQAVLLIKGELIDEDVELGIYDFQIRLLDENKNSVASLPPIKDAIHIDRPLFDDAEATADYSVTDLDAVAYEETSPDTYNPDGTYNQTNWAKGDIISSAKLNKLEQVAKDNVDKIKAIPTTGVKGDKGDKGEQGVAGRDGLTTAVSVNGKTYTQVNGTITLPNYPENTGGAYDSTELMAELDSKTVDYIYNVNALNKVRSLKYMKIVCIGDSIGAGTAAPQNNGFLNQLSTTLAYHQGFLNYDTKTQYYENTGWDKEEDGICKQLVSSSDPTKPLKPYQYGWVTPSLEDYKVSIVYSTRTDGGEFDVSVDGGEHLDTINCNGAKKDGLISKEYTIPKGKNILVTPKANNKAYFNFFMIHQRPSKKESHEFENWSVGGRKAKDYTLDQLTTMVSYKKFDVLIWELFANDYSGQDLDTYKSKTEHVISEAKKLGLDVIIPITCGNEMSDSTEDNYRLFRENWVGYLYDVAKRHNCCIIDYDKKFGGHKKAKANNLIADSIHPNYTGHMLMANDLCNILLGVNSADYDNLSLFMEDSRRPTYGANSFNKPMHYSQLVTFAEPRTITYDNNGNNWYGIIQPIIGASNNNPAKLPKFAPKGAIGTCGNNVYINTTESNGKTTPATWEDAMANKSKIETLTSAPAKVNDDFLNRIFRYVQEGKDDQFITYIATSAGGRKWVKLSTEPFSF